MTAFQYEIIYLCSTEERESYIWDGIRVENIMREFLYFAELFVETHKSFYFKSVHCEKQWYCSTTKTSCKNPDFFNMEKEFNITHTTDLGQMYVCLTLVAQVKLLSCWYPEATS